MCILLIWITDEAPTLNQCTVTNVIHFEAFSMALNDKPFTFYRIWNTFFDHMGAANAQRMKSGLMDLAQIKKLGTSHLSCLRYVCTAFQMFAPEFAFYYMLPETIFFNLSVCFLFNFNGGLISCCV